MAGETPAWQQVRHVLTEGEAYDTCHPACDARFRLRCRHPLREVFMLPHYASDPASDPPIPDQPAVPPGTPSPTEPSPGRPADLPDIGAPEPEPDQPPPATGVRA
jgi:hypothetical protein